MRPLLTKLTPSRGFSQVLHLAYNIILPLLVFILVQSSFIQLAFSLILLSKWRMFAVRPRFWLANVRANAVDIVIGLSALALIVSSGNTWLELFWTAAWAAWLLFLKPATTTLLVAVQAFASLVAGLSALLLVWDQGPLAGLVGAVGLICYFAAHHFFDSFDEPYARLLSFTWAFFGSALAWVLGHWLLFYGVVAQLTLIISAIGLGLGTLYYLDHYDKLSAGLRRQFVFIMLAVVLVVLVFSDWGDKIV